MLRHDRHPKSPNLTRRRPLRGALRGGAATLGSLLALISLGATGALAGPPTSLLAPGGATTGSTTAAAAAPAQTTGPTGTTTGTQGVSTSAASSVLTTSTPPTQPPAPAGSLVVTLTASPLVARIGQTVTYTAEVFGAPPGKKLNYSWAYDGGVATGRQISHSYQVAGDYPVAVTVTVATVAGLSGGDQKATTVVPNSPPAKLHGSGNLNGGGSGSGHGKGGGGGTASSTSSTSAAARAVKRARAIRTQGVANPLPTQAPSAASGLQVEGFLLSETGTPFVAPNPTAPSSASSSAAGGDAGPVGAGGAAAVGGALALTIAIVTLGALDERRRISLRHA